MIDPLHTSLTMRLGIAAQLLRELATGAQIAWPAVVLEQMEDLVLHHIVHIHREPVVLVGLADLQGKNRKEIGERKGQITNVISFKDQRISWLNRP